MPRDPRRPATPAERRPRWHGQRGSIARALLWVVLGFALAVGLLAAVSPELVVSEPGILVDLIGVASLAAIPGIVLLLVAAVRRRRLGLDEEER